MSKRIAMISYEKEITDIEYDNLFNSLKSYEKDELFCNFKGQISNSNIKCKKCKTSVKDIVHTNLLVCPCCFETIYKLIENKKLKPTLIYSNFIKRLLCNDFRKYRGKKPEYAKEFFENEIKISDLERELEHSIETEEFLKCDILKNAIEDLKKKNLKFRRRINE
ncbi:hypothetical protein VJI72_00635 [Parvimonas micra]|uniref:hypothetical protein n=1 Tax=Parvimonas micra TaxID=33033 RepID=UPI002B4A25CE|nr:hypothetical protein [Parvimonas micra]MEB3028295.1 hypothetical protein [Parvimonas micra]